MLLFAPSVCPLMAEAEACVRFLMGVTACVHAKSLQSCPTLRHPMDCSPPGPSVHGIFQARILEWVAISFSRDLPNPGIEPGSPALQVDAFLSELLGKK